MEEHVQGLENDLSLLEVAHDRLEQEKNTAIETLESNLSRLKLQLDTDRQKYSMLIVDLSSKYRQKEQELSKSQLETRSLECQAESLRLQLDSLSRVRICKDLERVLTELSEAQARDSLAYLTDLSREDLITHCEIVSLFAKKREKELHKVGEDLRKTKVELERATRQLKKAIPSKRPALMPIVTHDLSNENSNLRAGKQSKLEAVPIDLSELFLQSSSNGPRNSFGLAAPGYSFVAPPKFQPLRQHSTISDGIGGHKKTLQFPTCHK